MFSLQSLDIAQTEIVRKTIHSSHQYDREMQKALERVRDERNNLEDVLRETNEELKTEHIARMAGVTTANELNAVLQQVEAELSHAQEENRRARTETAQEKARLEANYMEQLISALNLIQIKEAPPNRADAYAWHLCPVSGEVMTDPVIINAPYCACTCDRSSFQKWTDFGGRTCPVCGVALGSNRVQPNSGLRDAIQSRLQSLSQSETNMPHDNTSNDNRSDNNGNNNSNDNDSSIGNRVALEDSGNHNDNHDDDNDDDDDSVGYWLLVTYYVPAHFAAWILLILSTTSCEFVTISGMTNGGASSETISRGIWRGEADVGSSCEQHGNVYVDSKWKVAQAFSIIGCLYGSGLFCCGLSKDRSEVHPMLWVCIGLLVDLDSVSVDGACFFVMSFISFTSLSTLLYVSTPTRYVFFVQESCSSC
jgi:hypothetical protein